MCVKRRIGDRVERSMGDCRVWVYDKRAVLLFAGISSRLPGFDFRPLRIGFWVGKQVL
jgi:hypothetical protein